MSDQPEANGLPDRIDELEKKTAQLGRRLDSLIGPAINNPRRAWRPRYSLATLFFVVTALGCWLGWESSVVRERRAILSEVRAGGMFQIITADQIATGLPPGIAARPQATVPRVRRWLGDEPVQEIWFIRYTQGFSESQLN